MFGGVGKGRIEVQADNVFATYIFDARVDAGRLEAQELHGARGRAGGRRLCMERRRQESEQEKEEQANPDGKMRSC